ADGSYWLYDYDVMGQLIQARRYWSDGLPVAGQSFAYGFDDIGNRTATTNNGDAAAYQANLLNQYEQRDVPGRADVLGRANPEAVVTVNSQVATRQEAGYYHRALSVANTNAAGYPELSVVHFYSRCNENDRPLQPL
ncbi:MAG: hypothetical protein K9N49_04700, partial [Candidatus Marinimicrobia bacterium]|nr:hypothetical protein [Candidatus Neomarinimicrobiota bacterium]